MTEKYATMDNFNQLTEDQKKLFIDVALHYKTEYEKGVEQANGISAAASFHQEIDNQVQEGFKKDPIKVSCKKGCSFCCYVHNEITSDEAQLLMEYSQEQGIEIDMDQLLRQQGKTLQDYKIMKASDRRCVFLSREDAECTVYEHRPGTCRKYYVASDPELCDMDNNKSEDVMVIVSTPVEMIFTGMGLAAKKTGLMADLLIEKLNEQSTKTGTPAA